MNKQPLKTLRAWHVLLALAAGGAAYAMHLQKPVPVEYVTADAEIGTVTSTVVANGTVNPVKLVSVGTQVSGTVKRYFADFNDTVKEGQVLLEIDDSQYRAQRNASSAQAGLARTDLELATAQLLRAKDLFAKGFVPLKDLETAQKTLDAARAQLKVASANLERDSISVGNSIIRSPVSGVVVTRAVDVGQTVAASLSTPELYKIAQDLSKMRISTNFAEADISAIKTGQPVKFAVDAYPGEWFAGAVSQIRLQPTTSNNVVTYNVVIDVENKEMKLLPGMTANVNVQTESAIDVLTVPAAALRFKPLESGERLNDKPGSKEKVKAKGTYVYTLGPDNAPVRVAVKVGLNDGARAQVSAAELTPGTKVITDVRSLASSPEGGPGMKFRMF